MAEEDHLSRVLSDPRVRASVERINRGTFWTKAFLGAGLPGAELTSRFLAGRKDLLELTVVDFEQTVPPTVIGASGRNQTLRLAQWAGVEKQIADLNDPALVRSARLGRLLDASNRLLSELQDWLQAPANADQLELAAQLGPQAFRQITATDNSIESIDLVPYDPSPGISFGLKD